MRFKIWLADYNWSIERPASYLGYRVPEVVFICPFCLSHWGSIEMEPTGPEPFHIQASSCSGCPPSSRYFNVFPGSILENSHFSDSFDRDLLAALPPDLLKREYDLHISQYERYLANEPANVSPDPLTQSFTIDQLDAINAAWCKHPARRPDRDR